MSRQFIVTGHLEGRDPFEFTFDAPSPEDAKAQFLKLANQIKDPELHLEIHVDSVLEFNMEDIMAMCRETLGIKEEQ